MPKDDACVLTLLNNATLSEMFCHATERHVRAFLRHGRGLPVRLGLRQPCRVDRERR